MAHDDCPAGTCVFHSQYEEMLKADHDIVNGLNIKVQIMCNKIETHKEESNKRIDAVEETVKEKERAIKDEFNKGLRRLYFSILGALVLQIIIAFAGGRTP